jgi:glycosyltransferase involved in cell wall biosynthesis
VRVEVKRAKRASNALRSLRAPSALTDDQIWAVTMVLNEQDIIEESVRHLFDEGVDHVLIADNGSTDDTPRILQQLAKDFPVHVVRDPVVPYLQAAKVSLLARTAARHGAAWIIPFDADELWAASDPSRSLRQVLVGSDVDLVSADWFDYVARECDGICVETAGLPYAARFPYRSIEPDAVWRKVAFRANWLAFVRQGNHHVFLPKARVGDGLRVAHFRLRTPAQMLQKAKDGTRAVQAAGRVSEYWSHIAAGGEALARQLLLEQASRTDLVFDPVSERQRARAATRSASEATG